MDRFVCLHRTKEVHAVLLLPLCCFGAFLCFPRSTERGQQVRTSISHSFVYLQIGIKEVPPTPALSLREEGDI